MEIYHTPLLIMHIMPRCYIGKLTAIVKIKLQYFFLYIIVYMSVVYMYIIVSDITYFGILLYLL